MFLTLKEENWAFLGRHVTANKGNQTRERENTIWGEGCLPCQNRGGMSQSLSLMFWCVLPNFHTQTANIECLRFYVLALNPWTIEPMIVLPNSAPVFIHSKPSLERKNTILMVWLLVPSLLLSLPTSFLPCWRLNSGPLQATQVSHHRVTCQPSFFLPSQHVLPSCLTVDLGYALPSLAHVPPCSCDQSKAPTMACSSERKKFWRQLLRGASWKGQAGCHAIDHPAETFSCT